MFSKQKKMKLEPFKVLIIQDGQKVFKDSGSREKVVGGLKSWFKYK